MTALGGAKLADDETEDDNDSFGFLIRDMKPEYWYLRRRQILFENLMSCYRDWFSLLSLRISVLGAGTMR